MTSHLAPHRTIMTTSHAEVDSISQLQTEAPSLLARSIYTLDALGVCKAFKHEGKRVSPTIACCPPVLASLVEDLVPRLQAEGRLICVGAGNRGLLGFIGCSELPAIFSVEGDPLPAIIAKGSEAIIKSPEVAEDSKPDGSTQLERLQIISKGTLFSISASGRIVLVLGALRVTLRQDAATASITNTTPSAIESLRVSHSIKLACVLFVSALRLDVLRCRLDSLQPAISDQTPRLSRQSGEVFFLAVDGGGTKCAVSVASRAGIVARAHAGAGNFHSVPIDALMDHIKCAVMKAISHLPKKSTPLCSAKMPKFAAVWAGLAGLQHANRRECLTKSLEQLFGVSAEDGTLRLSSDSELISAHIGLDDSVSCGISLIAGTGSVATAFKRDPNGDVLQIGRAGGWGPLLGDQGSAFDIGKQAVQALLTSLELSQGTETDCLSELEREVLASLGHCKEGLLSRVLFPETEMKKTIAGLSRVVTRLGFRTTNPDPRALEILTSAARSLVQIVRPLAKRQICDPATSSLILSGALMKIPEFQRLFLNELSREGIWPFKNMVTVDDPSSDAALFLARQASRTKLSSTVTCYA